MSLTRRLHVSSSSNSFLAFPKWQQPKRNECREEKGSKTGGDQSLWAFLSHIILWDVRPWGLSKTEIEWYRTFNYCRSIDAIFLAKYILYFGFLADISSLREHKRSTRKRRTNYGGIVGKITVCFHDHSNKNQFHKMTRCTEHDLAVSLCEYLLHNKTRNLRRSWRGSLNKERKSGIVLFLVSLLIMNRPNGSYYTA
jgi:hypothetical protein